MNKKIININNYLLYTYIKNKILFNYYALYL